MMWGGRGEVDEVDTICGKRWCELLAWALH